MFCNFALSNVLFIGATFTLQIAKIGNLFPSNPSNIPILTIIMDKVHDFTQLEVLKAVLKEIFYFYDIETNKEFLLKMGYSKSTYLSDILGGKVEISPKFINRLKSTFHVNPGVFDGTSLEIFDEESEFQATIGKKKHKRNPDGINAIGDQALAFKGSFNSSESITQLANAINRSLDAIQSQFHSFQKQSMDSKDTINRTLGEVTAHRKIIEKLVDMLDDRKQTNSEQPELS